MRYFLRLFSLVKSKNQVDPKQKSFTPTWQRVWSKNWENITHSNSLYSTEHDISYSAMLCWYHQNIFRTKVYFNKLLVKHYVRTIKKKSDSSTWRERGDIFYSWRMRYGMARDNNNLLASLWFNARSIIWASAS